MNRKYSYFIGNVLVQVKHVFFPDHHLVLSLLKLKSVGDIFKPTKYSVQTVLVLSLLKLRSVGGIFEPTKCSIQIRETSKIVL